MFIRPARIDDWRGISRLLDQLGYAGTAGFMEERMAAMLADPAVVLLVFEREAAVLGFLSLLVAKQAQTREDFARITALVTDDTVRGQGIGRQLEEEATRIARYRGCGFIELHCHERRTLAHAFYARQGYVEDPKYLIKRL